MKTFRQLTIGDTIYYTSGYTKLLDTKDNYGNVTEARVFDSAVIRTLGLSEKGNLLINESKTYNRDIVYLAAIPSELIDSSIADSKDKKFYVSEAQKESILREMVLNHISSNEASIIAHANKMKKEIRQLRAKYWNTLNPSLTLSEIESPEFLEA